MLQRDIPEDKAKRTLLPGLVSINQKTLYKIEKRLLEKLKIKKQWLVERLEIESSGSY